MLNDLFAQQTFFPNQMVQKPKVNKTTEYIYFKIQLGIFYCTLYNCAFSLAISEGNLSAKLMRYLRYWKYCLLKMIEIIAL